ncbi:MAG: pyruvate kinase [Candidatus Melainabacteria bacterium RIFCSPHIGHO2_02_FULL_34_12]|nr:MAG: pyruvate kinase [Candidatus Melainabacteria bacterium RIFCSPHIGHO2_02_FULL_34_12]
MPEKTSRLTKIIATIGPASREPDVIEALIKAGTNVFRINCSHSDLATRTLTIKNIRKVSGKLKKEIGILLDLQGPKIRVGKLKNGSVSLKDKSKIILTSEFVTGTDKKFQIVNFNKIIDTLTSSHRVLLDDGKIELKVLGKVNSKELQCQVLFGGELKDGKGVNFPDTHLKDLNPLTDKDKKDLKHGLDNKVDLIALSFVRSAKDILALRELLPKNSFVKIIAKIEKPQALDDLSNILKVADGIMVARGDLGVELSPEKLPTIQKRIIQQANENNVLVITATQMLESMINSPKPTRAEVSDVANAIFDGTDAIMLSGETASGKYPALTVETMHKIALEAESVAPRLRHDVKTVQENLARSACELAERVKATAIASFTLSGTTAKLVSKQRPPVKVLALTQNEMVSRQLSLCWGTTPILLMDVYDTEAMMNLVEKTLIEHKLVKKGDIVIVTGGLPIAARGESNFIKIHKCEGK